MILVDTSIWVDHFRKNNAQLRESLRQGRVLCHPFIIGELACGGLTPRDDILRHLAALPQAESADHDEVMHLLESRSLHGKGIGWVDVHLLASALISRSSLWTKDKALRAVAEKVGVGLPAQ